MLFLALQSTLRAKEGHVQMTLVSQTLEDYAGQHTTSLLPLLEELITTTREQMGPMSLMLSGPTVGTLLQTLVAATGARLVLDIGTFTGFSALMMAAALPEGGKVITCDRDPRAISIARQFFARSPHGHKIELREGPALETIASIQEPIDFAFIDADKEGYINYYEAVLPRLSERGLIAADNVLYLGWVVEPKDDQSRAIAAFNQHVQRDERVTNVILTVRDGVMLARRK